MLDIIPMQMCRSNDEWSCTVKGSRGDYLVQYGPDPTGRYERDFSCNCEGFKFRKQCKHIKIAKEKFCGWHEQFDGGEVKDGKCPRCQGKVMVVMVGV